jgi:hypothetical protein
MPSYRPDGRATTQPVSRAPGDQTTVGARARIMRA